MEFLIIENNPDRAEQFDAMGIDRIFIEKRLYIIQCIFHINSSTFSLVML